MTTYTLATKAYVDANAGATPDATTSAKGKVQLAGDLAGTAAAPILAATDNVARILRASGPNRYFRRTGAIAETFSRRGAPLGSQAGLAAGQNSGYGIELIAGDLISKITFCASTTALVSGVNQWFSLWSSAFGLLGVTNDDTTASWGSALEKQLTLASPYTVPTTGLYYIGAMVNAATLPTLMGVGTQAGFVGAYTPLTAWRDTAHSSLTNPASCPTTATPSVSGLAPLIWGWVS